MPAPTLMVRSRGSYSRTLFSAAVEMVTSDGAMGPPIRPLVEFPTSAIRWLSRACLGQTLRQFLGAARNNGHELAIVSAAFASARIDLR